MVKAQASHWIALAAAILFEVGGTSILKFSQAWTFPYAEWTGLGLMFLAICYSYYCLAKATTGIPVGVAFAFWEAFGLALIALIDFSFMGETVSVERILGLFCVLIGAMLVNKGTEHGASPQDSTKTEEENIHG